MEGYGFHCREYIPYLLVNLPKIRNIFLIHWIMFPKQGRYFPIYRNFLPKYGICYSPFTEIRFQNKKYISHSLENVSKVKNIFILYRKRFPKYGIYFPCLKTSPNNWPYFIFTGKLSQNTKYTTHLPENVPKIRNIFPIYRKLSKIRNIFPFFRKTFPN